MCFLQEKEFNLLAFQLGTLVSILAILFYTPCRSNEAIIKSRKRNHKSERQRRNRRTHRTSFPIDLGQTINQYNSVLWLILRDLYYFICNNLIYPTIRWLCKGFARVPTFYAHHVPAFLCCHQRLTFSFIDVGYLAHVSCYHDPHHSFLQND